MNLPGESRGRGMIGAQFVGSILYAVSLLFPLWIAQRRWAVRYIAIDTILLCLGMLLSCGRRQIRWKVSGAVVIIGALSFWMRAVGVLGDIGLGVWLLCVGAGFLLCLRYWSTDRATVLVMMMTAVAVITADRIVGAPSWSPIGRIAVPLLAGWAAALVAGIMLGWAIEQRSMRMPD